MPYSYFNVSYENLAVCQFTVVKCFLINREFTALKISRNLEVVIILSLIHI